MKLTEQIIQECLAARKRCVLFDHPDRGIIEVRGSDRIQFLNNILSNDIKSLSAGEGMPACFLNAQAKLIAYMNALCFDQFLWLALDYRVKDKLLEALHKTIIMEQVELVDRSDELKLISLHGPQARRLFKTVLKQDEPTELLSHRPVTIDGISTVVIRINLIGETGYGFLTQKDKATRVQAALEQNGGAKELTHIQASAMEILRIEAGIPRYGVDFDESSIPLEAGLDKAVSFSKGCFPGQEILARLDSRGGVSKKLCGLVLKGETPPKKDDRILQDGAEVGRITSAVFSPTLKKTIAMGYLKKECWVIGCLVAVEIGNIQIPARVESIPFYAAGTA